MPWSLFHDCTVCTCVTEGNYLFTSTYLPFSIQSSLPRTNINLSTYTVLNIVNVFLKIVPKSNSYTNTLEIIWIIIHLAQSCLTMQSFFKSYLIIKGWSWLENPLHQAGYFRGGECIQLDLPLKKNIETKKHPEIPVVLLAAAIGHQRAGAAKQFGTNLVDLTGTFPKALWARRRRRGPGVKWGDTWLPAAKGWWVFSKKQNKKVHNIVEGRFLGCHIMWKSG